MKTSTEIHSIASVVGEQKAIELIAKAGFDAYDLSLFDMAIYDWGAGAVKDIDHPLRSKDYLKFVREIKKVADDCGIHCNQSHAPFPSESPEVVSYYKKAIECTAEVGGKICIIHPFTKGTPEENAEMYGKILPFAKEMGVKIATENMYRWPQGSPTSIPGACASADDFKKHIEAVNDEYFVACLDIGHAEMQGGGGGAVNIINALGNHLQALHIHDVDRIHDNHQLPFTLEIEYESIMKALKENGYSGYLTLEASTYMSAYDKENAFEGVKKMAETAKKLSDMMER